MHMGKLVLRHGVTLIDNARSLKGNRVDFTSGMWWLTAILGRLTVGRVAHVTRCLV